MTRQIVKTHGKHENTVQSILFHSRIIYLQSIEEMEFIHLQ